MARPRATGYATESRSRARGPCHHSHLHHSHLDEVFPSVVIGLVSQPGTGCVNSGIWQVQTDRPTLACTPTSTFSDYGSVPSGWAPQRALDPFERADLRDGRTGGQVPSSGVTA
ncbi:hypothetical protein ACFFX0_27650 [Citricoccus parietis]|uniref:Uncharacterized protein n=1 Tax=Citricoccus parietis TaxID=592307 RepID=A0ABV5G756_9MICC